MKTFQSFHIIIWYILYFFLSCHKQSNVLGWHWKNIAKISKNKREKDISIDAWINIKQSLLPLFLIEETKQMLLIEKRFPSVIYELFYYIMRPTVFL